jgi:hypothetical protein
VVAPEVQVLQWVPAMKKQFYSEPSIFITRDTARAVEKREKNKTTQTSGPPVSPDCQGLIPELLSECVRRAHFGVEEVRKELAL